MTAPRSDAPKGIDWRMWVDTASLRADKLPLVAEMGLLVVGAVTEGAA